MKDEQLKTNEQVTAEVIKLLNDAFKLHDASILNNLIADECGMEAAMPAPNGSRTIGKKDFLAFLATANSNN